MVSQPQSPSTTIDNPQTKKPLGQRIKAILWPIEPFEKPKVLPMILMMFFMTCSYTMVRDLKKVLSVGISSTASMFMKLFLVLPASIIFMFIFNFLSSKFSKQSVFYIIIGSFAVLNMLYIILVSIRDKIEPGQSFLADFEKKNSYRPAVAFAALYAYWTTPYFFVISELWGSAAISLLYYQFANDIFTVHEAKRIYPVITLGANASLFIGGLTLIIPVFVSAAVQDKLTYVFLALIVAQQIGVMGCYFWMQKFVLTNPALYDPAKIKPKKKKDSLGVWASLKLVFSSKYILAIATIVMMYGLSINIVETFHDASFKTYFENKIVPYKAAMDAQTSGTPAYATAKAEWSDKKKEVEGLKTAYMGSLSMVNGFAVFCLLTLVGGRAIDKIGYTKTALLTPTTIFLFGIPAMSAALAIGVKTELLKDQGVLLMSCIFGFLTVALGRSVKYSFFDPTKEMAYIPLDDELKTKGKSAVDVVGGRFGKSGSGLIQVTILFIVNNDDAWKIIPYVFPVFFVAIVAWYFATVDLGLKFARIQAEKNDSVVLKA